MNQKNEIEYKDFMCQRIYGYNEENQEIICLVILSDVHEDLGNTYVPRIDFESHYITNKKEFTILNANDQRMHITPEKAVISDIILSNDIYLTQQNYQHHHNANGNTPSDQSDKESDDENFYDEI